MLSGYYGQNGPTKKRAVFFSFHFESDLLRVNIIRNSGQFLESKGHFDKSLWEESKTKGEAALKKLINDGLEGTTVTCVLSGAETYSRPWVRYEIAKSVVRGNGLLTVDISQVECMNTGYCEQGPNPLAYMGVYETEGKYYLAEYKNGTWVQYSIYLHPISWPPYLKKLSTGQVQQLDNGAGFYRWSNHSDLSFWADKAAKDAGR